MQECKCAAFRGWVSVIPIIRATIDAKGPTEEADDLQHIHKTRNGRASSSLITIAHTFRLSFFYQAVLRLFRTLE
jgi:hypothetical protein